jgi:DNA repair exonuclease SbcCD ATPase subunit
MSIRFHDIEWKNFLSTGNTPTKINFEETKSTLIVGHNGAGKSTLLDALSFALFGKPHRNINKPNVVNSINNKDCLVTVNFSVGNTKYRVVRGLKPQIFEIWRDGTMINQAAHAREYQKVLEQNILKLNHKSFHQIVVLGSSSFIPFMQLSAQHRREVIEDLLDINVFSKMNLILRERISRTRDDLKGLEHRIEMGERDIKGKEKYIQDMERVNDGVIDEREDQIKGIRKDIESLQEENNTLSKEIEELTFGLDDTIRDLQDRKDTIHDHRTKFKIKIESLVKDAKFYENNDHCPTCDQDIPEELKSTKLKHAKSKASELQSAMKTAQEREKSLTEKLLHEQEKNQKVYKKNAAIASNNKAIQRLQDSIDAIEKEIRGYRDKNRDLDLARHDLEECKVQLKENRENREKLKEEYTYNQVIAEMLKDSGIKTKVIKQYLPVINKLVNQYLQVLDFFVHFYLDEEFKEEIRSRHRDAFSYDSFSEGEKQRIDLSLLFTWRMIAKMKNSVSTNLLILDETFDSSLDHDGIDNLMKILHTLGEDTNIFIISHKGEILDGKFKRKLEFVKEKNFSKCVAA